MLSVEVIRISGRSLIMFEVKERKATKTLLSFEEYLLSLSFTSQMQFVSSSLHLCNTCAGLSFYMFLSSILLSKHFHGPYVNQET